MAGAGIDIRAEGLVALETRLADLLTKFGDLTVLMDRIGQAMETTTAERWDAEISPEGIPWKKSNKPEGKTLIGDGKRGPSARLKNSITHKASRDSVRIGTNVIYAAIHQYGFSGSQSVKAHKRTVTSIFGRRLSRPLEQRIGAFTRTMTMPARPFLGVSTEDEAEISAQFEDFLLEQGDAA